MNRDVYGEGCGKVLSLSVQRFREGLMKAREYLVKARTLLDVGCPLYGRACRKVFPGAILRCLSVSQPQPSSP
jgi:hypothetical protein